MSIHWIEATGTYPYLAGNVRPATPVPPTPEVSAEGGEALLSSLHAEARRSYESAPKERHPVLLARDVMKSPVFTLDAKSPLAEARSFFLRHDVRHGPVTDADESLVGLLAERDLLRGRRHPRHGDGAPNTATPVFACDLMSTRLLTARPESPIRDVARAMVEERVGCLPILDSNRALTGIITTTDLLRCIVTGAPVELWA